MSLPDRRTFLQSLTAAAAAAATLGLKPGQVTMNVQTAGGGFGRRFVGSSDYVVEACQVQ